MEDNSKEPVVKKNDITHAILKHIETKWPVNITILNLGHRNLSNIDGNVHFPPNLMDLNLSHNKFVEIPSTVLNLDNLKSLNISFNEIVYFDSTPDFCHCIEHLNLANNRLQGLPYWIWTETPAKLEQLDLSGNMNIMESVHKYEKFLQYRTLITDVKLYNCRLKHPELLQTFSKAKLLEFGTPDFSCSLSNHLLDVPCKGLDQCCDIEKLNLSNTHIYNIGTNIDIFKNLIEINLSQNSINGLPNEFCHLGNLEICILSYNNIFYLPDDMVELKKLVCLRLDSNKLCMLPENISELPQLNVLDLYDNCLYEVSNQVQDNISELDLAQNYLEEPDDIEYLEKKGKLRFNTENRSNGKKEVSRPESIHSPDITDESDDEELLNLNNYEQTKPNNDPPSSPEDWDSDDYWVPCGFRSDTTFLPQSSWMYYVKQKIQEGNFCPIDMHAIPIDEQVKQERLLNPKVWHEVRGQFDDYSENDSDS